jgi:regulatory protein
MTTLKQQYTPKESKVKIAKFCAYQERCHQEVRDKLYAYGLLPNDVEEIIYELIQNDFINEERFAKAFVRGKFNYKKWGRIKITQELKKRKISKYCINKGLGEISEEKYKVVLTEILDKKSKQFSSLKEYQKNYKAVQFAMGKGYESTIAWSIINSKKNN